MKVLSLLLFLFCCQLINDGYKRNCKTNFKKNNFVNYWNQQTLLAIEDSKDMVSKLPLDSFKIAGEVFMKVALTIPKKDTLEWAASVKSGLISGYKFQVKYFLANSEHYLNRNRFHDFMASNELFQNNEIYVVENFNGTDYFKNDKYIIVLSDDCYYWRFPTSCYITKEEYVTCNKTAIINKYQDINLKEDFLCNTFIGRSTSLVVWSKFQDGCLIEVKAISRICKNHLPVEY
jgi:hypothetical protein